MEKITSRRNPLIQRAREAREGRARNIIFIEGVRLCEEAARSTLVVEDALCDEKLNEAARGARLLEDLRAKGARLHLARADVLASISDTKTPQGIILIARRPTSDKETLAIEARKIAAPLLVVLHRINNPANAGAALRAAEAAGASGVIATAGTTDLFAPKTLRGAMGSAFRLPIWTGAKFEEVISWCRAQKILTCASDLRAVKTYTEIDWTQARAVIFGSEAHGLSPIEIAATDERIKIPMRAPVESLNVSIAVGVILYEAARQREFR